jgi:hypothetical protein
MSSVTRFLTQINSSAAIFSAGNIASVAYDFNAASGNVVGNYPPGYVTVVPASTAALITSAVSAGAVLRDMGKTIYAGIGATPTAYGRFRQVQVLVPSVGNNNFIGGTTGSTSGVIGGVGIGSTLTNYMTFYIPVANNGLTAVLPLSTSSALGGANQL